MAKKLNRRFILLICVLASIGVGPLVSQGRAEARAESLLEQAIAKYDAGLNARDRDERLSDFAAAEQLFRQLIEGSDAPLRNAALYVNLGNAALQAERVGPAILAYRRALEIDRTNSQAQQNLGYARQAVPERYRRELTNGLIDTLFFWNAMYSRSQIFGFAGFCFLIAALMIALGIARQWPLLRSFAVVPALCWLICLASAFFGFRASVGVEGVVIASELTVHSADSENSAPRFSEPISSGVEVTILRQRDRWTEIELAGGRSGWVLNSGLEKL